MRANLDLNSELEFMLAMHVTVDHSAAGRQFGCGSMDSARGHWKIDNRCNYAIEHDHRPAFVGQYQWVNRSTTTDKSRAGRT